MSSQLLFRKLNKEHYFILMLPTQNLSLHVNVTILRIYYEIDIDFDTVFIC